MFLGHFSVGLMAKKAVPAVSLGTLFLASQLLDLLWPTFILLGLESVEIEPGITVMTPLHFTHYPYSHSLLMAIVWGVIFGLLYYLIKRRSRESIILFLCVISHWILDLITHQPDLPLYPGQTILVGWGLWNYPILETMLEAGIFIMGVILYLRTTKAKNNVGKYSFWALIVFLILIHTSNLFSPPPPNTAIIAWVGELQWLVVIWAYWVDKNRVVNHSRHLALNDQT